MSTREPKRALALGSAPDAFDAEPFGDVPDPAARFAPAKVPPPVPPSEPSPTRPERRRRALIALVLSLAWIGVVLAPIGLRPDLATPMVLMQLTSWTIVGALAFVASLRAGDKGLPPTLRVVQVVSAAVPAAFVLITLLWKMGPDAAISWNTVRPCLLTGLLIALGPIILSAATFRRTFLNAPAWRGAAVGAACGLAGAIGVHAHCPMGAMSHVLLAHGLPVLAGALAGAALGRFRGRV